MNEADSKRGEKWGQLISNYVAALNVAPPNWKQANTHDSQHALPDARPFAFTAQWLRASNTSKLIAKSKSFPEKLLNYDIRLASAFSASLNREKIHRGLVFSYFIILFASRVSTTTPRSKRRVPASTECLSVSVANQGVLGDTSRARFSMAAWKLREASAYLGSDVGDTDYFSTVYQ